MVFGQAFYVPSLLYSGFLDMLDLLCSLCDLGLGLLDKLNSRIGLPQFFVQCNRPPGLPFPFLLC